MKKCCSKNSKAVLSGLLDNYNAMEKVIFLSPEVACWLSYTQIFTPYKLLIKMVDFVIIKMTKNCATEEQSSKSQKSLVDRGCK